MESWAYLLISIQMEPGGSVLKNLPAKAEDAGDAGSISGVGRSPGGGNDNPLQCSCLENPRDGGAWWGAVYGVAQSRTRLKQLSSNQCRRLKRYGFDPWVRKIPWRRKWQPTLVFLPGESQDRGAWRATVHRVAKSRT